MTNALDMNQLKQLATPKNQYPQQLARMKQEGRSTDCVQATVDELVSKLKKNTGRATVIYGEPQSGKTEMMICLTAALLDGGARVIIHLMNDNLDLLTQNFGRFQTVGLAPSPVSSKEIHKKLDAGKYAIIFCKKNGKDLANLLDYVGHLGELVVIDDEADYATPNAKVNQKTAKGAQEKTPIHKLIEQLIGSSGRYIGVTATPARLNLNNTFDTKTDEWVQFNAHGSYSGQNVFFPMVPVPNPDFRLKVLPAAVTEEHAREAFARFLVTVAYLNTVAENGKPLGGKEQNYSLLVHTSGRTEAHIADRNTIEKALEVLRDPASPDFSVFVDVLDRAARDLYPAASSQNLLAYVIKNASRSSLVVLNSNRNRALSTDPKPTCPFSVFFGGNMVSRGVTFPNLLAMFFARDVKHKLQQDTYIQRARMFGGDRIPYQSHFELTIPEGLYEDWRRCFVFHRLALSSIKNNQLPPVWIGDTRISVAQPSSVEKTTVNLDKGEMSYQKFPVDKQRLDNLDAIVAKSQTDVSTLVALQQSIGDALPSYLVEYIIADLKARPGQLIVHKSSSISGQKSATTNSAEIERQKGFMGKTQMEIEKYGERKHHIKIFHNGTEARVFYKNTGGVSFMGQTA